MNQDVIDFEVGHFGPLDDKMKRMSKDELLFEFKKLSQSVLSLRLSHLYIKKMAS